jgi:hypothetical protein
MRSIDATGDFRDEHTILAVSPANLDPSKCPASDHLQSSSHSSAQERS